MNVINTNTSALRATNAKLVRRALRLLAAGWRGFAI